VILLDTSAWIVLGGRHAEFAARIGTEDVAVCPPVAQEILQGTGTPARYRAVRNTLWRTTMLDDPVPLVRFEQAAQIYMTCREVGLTIRSSIDCLIAACAIAHAVPLLHDDRDFDHIATVSPLKAIRA
jgi:predicted nucleic acid-binding protein